MPFLSWKVPLWLMPPPHQLKDASYAPGYYDLVVWDTTVRQLINYLAEIDESHWSDDIGKLPNTLCCQISIQIYIQYLYGRARGPNSIVYSA